MENEIKELGDSYYIEIEEGSNNMGGFCWHNVVLLKHDDSSFYVEVIRNQQFVDFPGLSHGKWEKDRPMEKVQKMTQFVSYIYPFKNGIAVFEWKVQPDGRYWHDDDGYGMTDDNAVVLYAKMDQNGHFITPFSDEIPEQIKHR